MDMTSSHNGGEPSVFDHTGQQPSSYSSAPSFGPSLHPQRITHHDQSRSYVPKLTISPAHSMNSTKSQHSTTDSQIEFITNLKIRIAVLENDVAHATQAKDEAIKSSVIIARALGNVANNPELATKKLRAPEAEELEELRVEVKRLRRENGVLWGRIESQEASHMITHDNSASAVSKDKNTYQVSSEDSDYPLAIKSRLTHPIIDAAIKKIGAQDEPKHSYHSVDLNEETKLPNHVNLERLEDGSLAVPSGYPVLSSTPKRRNINDINTSTLDDVLSSSDDEEPEVKIEDQLLYQERANANFINIPAPAVLKAGFEFYPEKALRGDDYANRGYVNRNNYYARFNNRNTGMPTGPKPFEFPPDLSEGTSIWTTPQQRDDEINNHMRAADSRDHKFPDYFRYGVVYVPKDGDHDTLRGVHIGGLPKNIELRDVLARVRGGRVYSAVLLNTMAISGSNSALVTFVDEADAEAYVQYANAHPIVFDSEDSDEENVVMAIVTHLHTPTFPFSPAKLKTIFELNRTRILTIRNFPENLSLRRLETDLACRTAFRADSMLEWYMDEEGTLRMEFSSMDAAGSAFGMLASSHGYRQFRLELQFEKDSCEGSLEELEMPVEMRKPMFPRTEIGPREDRSGSSLSGNGNGNGDGGMTGDSALVMQRRRLAALQKQHDVIPSLRGEGLKSSSWADEVIEDSGANTAIEVSGRQTEEITTSKNNKDLEEKNTLRSQPHQTHSSTDSTSSTLIGPSTDAPIKDEDIAPVTPKPGPRILTGKQYLLEFAAAAKGHDTSTPTSTSTNPNPNTSPPISATTPSSNTSTPRPHLPRLTLFTTSLPPPPTITSKSPDPEPSSAEYSLHSFASSAVSAVSAGDNDSPLDSFPTEHTLAHIQVQAQNPAQAAGKAKGAPGTLSDFGGRSLFSAAGHPVEAVDSSQAIQPIQAIQHSVSNPVTRALNTGTGTGRKLPVVNNVDADTNVYFMPGADTEKAILDSEVGSPRLSLSLRGEDCDRDCDRDQGREEKILGGVNQVFSERVGVGADGGGGGYVEGGVKDGGKEIGGKVMGMGEGKGGEKEKGNEGNAKVQKHENTKMKMKMNPDEIDLDLGLESDGDVADVADVDADADENEGLFQKELCVQSIAKTDATTKTKTKAEMDISEVSAASAASASLADAKEGMEGKEGKESKLISYREGVEEGEEIKKIREGKGGEKRI
ncbi:hypothetical protein SBOR_3326 [Sclerotinia borealis F-4128]|uniref:RRM domain-containing protein n=1 Tax=Sclerotinia borealis (strain F-4128) TaxID=1432307 RepID=W9CK91_SCLBF|nr:hypothetical protein SBOR_3326 [Sclerotinia borealis F-4128]